MIALSRRHVYLEQVAVVAVTVGLLLPFAGKAFHIDDPLFVWTAKQIVANPLDFYGFEVNWGYRVLPMHEEMQNPPLFAYYLAIFGMLFGFDEPAMHAAGMVVAAVAALGVYRLAARCCGRPLLAAGLAMLSPVALVSATQVMCDVMLLALWTWALDFWLQGLEAGRARDLLLAAILCSLAALTKYFGMALLPLFAVQAVVQRRWAALTFLLLPLALLVGFEMLAYSLYGHGLIAGATQVARSNRSFAPARLFPDVLCTFIFLGGCYIGVWLVLLFLRPVRTALLTCLGMLAALPLVLVIGQMSPRLAILSGGEPRPEIVLQAAFLIATSVPVIWLALRDVWIHRDQFSLLLFLWIVGTIAFTAFLNWTVSARNLLPAAPAVGIVVARALDRVEWGILRFRRFRLVAPLLALGGLSVPLAFADLSLANGERQVAEVILSRYPPSQQPVWFSGHWGFHYYLEEGGARPVDMTGTPILRGSIFVAASWNPNFVHFPPTVGRRLGELTGPSPTWLTTMSGQRSAGFYSNYTGCLPYAFGSDSPHRFEVWQATRSFEMATDDIR